MVEFLGKKKAYRSKPISSKGRRLDGEDLFLLFGKKLINLFI